MVGTLLSALIMIHSFFPFFLNSLLTWQTSEYTGFHVHNRDWLYIKFHIGFIQYDNIPACTEPLVKCLSSASVQGCINVDGKQHVAVGE